MLAFSHIGLFRLTPWLPSDYVSRSLPILGLRNGLIRDDIDEEAHGLFKYISRILEPQASILKEMKPKSKFCGHFRSA